jgi:mono/diheme cytochrome c family protein
LFRTADRNQVQDYWRTINVEQGGSFDCTAAPDGSGAPTCPAQITTLLNAIESYVDYAIPLPIPPTTDPTIVARGQQIFANVAGCAGCHSGPRFTNSGAGSPTLALDIGSDVMPLIDATSNGINTCATTGYPDVDHTAIDGSPRSACMFDVPSLSGLASSPPYLHDGSAPTIKDVLEKTRGTMGDITSLSGSDEDALVEYLRSL